MELIQVFYTQCLLPSATILIHQLKSGWTDVGEVTDEKWGEILGACKSVSPKLSDHLTHLYILHQSHLTPTLGIGQIIVQHAPNVETPEVLYHLPWFCPSIQGYRTQVVKFLQDRMGSPSVLNPTTMYTRPPSYLCEGQKPETLYTARMQLAKTWIKELPNPPTKDCGCKEHPSL